MIPEFDRSPWKNIHADLALYRYQGSAARLARSSAPVLMLHGPMTSHRTWDRMGQFLWESGFENLYAVDIADVQMGSSLRHSIHYLRHVLYWLLEQHDYSREIVLIGHSTGGVLARRFLLNTEEIAPHIAFLFTLASPHTRTHFSYKVYVPSEDGADGVAKSSTVGTSLVQTPDIPTNTFITNIIGNAVGPYFDGTVRGVFLPEAVNQVMLLRHSDLKHDQLVLDEILCCLRGQRYRMQLYLQNLYMKTPDQDNMVGPFYFEINGIRSPFEGIFQAEAEHEYTFEDSSTPLATLAYPVDQSFVSTVFRLKDQSRTRPIRRRLFAKLLDSLGEDKTAIHDMQDNEGSRISLRVHTRRMPNLLSQASHE